MAGKKTTPAKAIVQIKLGRWYPMVAFPDEIACEVVLKCIDCGGIHVAAWGPQWFAGKPYRGFQILDDYDPHARAKSEFSDFKITKILAGIVIDPKMPWLTQGMYDVDREGLRN